MRRHNDRANFFEREGRGWYGDFRNYADVGGKVEALVQPGQRRATQDQVEAALLFAERLNYLKARRAGRVADPDETPSQVPTVRAYRDRHFELKEIRKVTQEREHRAIDQFVAVIGDVSLNDITARVINDYRLKRKKEPGQRRGTKLSARTIEIELQAMSSLLDSAVEDGILDVNPIRAMRTRRRRKGRKPEVEWLEPDEAWNLMLRAEEYDGKPHHRAIPYLYPILSTFLYTGGRRSEVFGLSVDDVDFKNEVVHFRPNKFRPDLKTADAERTLPLWPLLGQALETYIGEYQPSGLLFPSLRGEMIVDLRGSLAKVLTAAKITKKLTWHTLRHTFCSMRLQTTEGGKPVSLWTVKVEMGHSTTQLIERIYGHLPKDRRRLSVVDYRPLKLARGADRSA